MVAINLTFPFELEMPGCLCFGSKAKPHLLYDHRPLQLNNDDYSRVCKIPRKKVHISSLVF